MVHFDQVQESTQELPYACDLVMKGGLTSGVVYSSAIAELANDHRFHSIGGSSAGAIAAVLAAAAEYGRHTGNADAFKQLEKIPNLLAEEEHGETLLYRLFTPQASTAPYFELLWSLRTAAKSDASGPMKFARPIVRAALRARPTLRLWPLTVIAVAIAVWLLGPASFGAGIASGALLALGVIWFFAETVFHGSRQVVSNGLHAMKDNNHGLISGAGVAPDEDNAGQPIGLTPWLHEQIQSLARREVGDPPVTYGDLERHGIDLVTLTTNLTQGTSETFPFVDGTWAFDHDEFDELFPPNIVSFLECKGDYTGEDGLFVFPSKSDVPILLGARLSLSFPVLLSAVPVYRDVAERGGQPNQQSYQRMWLSDGGICSNLPVHLFDAALPTRPTYGINLATGATVFDHSIVEPEDPCGRRREIHMDYAARNVHRPISPNSDTQPPTTNIDSTVDLLGTLLDTMMNWTDNSAAQALGVRDRICTIRLRKEEGSMNLDMPGQTIRDLSFRGSAAGENLGSMVRENQPVQFQHTPVSIDGLATQWERHRWVRFRTLLDSLGEFSTRVSERYKAPSGIRGPAIDVSKGATYENTRKLDSYAQLCENEGRVRDALDPQALSGGWSKDLADIAKGIMADLPQLSSGDLRPAQTTRSKRRLILSTRPIRETPS